ncbi:MAG: UBA/THIF-type binding protein [Gemmatimonadetes bacterium]|jgi:adenylyltransferase/sulfurtransferase|nr:UBA/THIF-type binding protein [Gemmatimonadota bacterium]
MPSLSPDELLRYGRHLSLPDVGEAGQQRLAGARVLLVGAGGLGSPAALYLTAAGVGHLGIVDGDAVELSNLQRQVLHGTRDLGRSKVSSAESRLRDLNPHVQVAAYHTRLTSANALDLLRGHDLVLDGTDNFASRYLLNDACVLLGIPLVHGSVLRFDGQAAVFGAADGPCYRCVFPEPPLPGQVPGCAEAGVFGVLPGLVGTIQAAEAIKLLLGIGESLAGQLLLVDALRMRFRSIAIARDPACPACGTREITTLGDYEAMCGAPASAVSGSGDAAASAHDDAGDDIEPEVLAARIRSGTAPLLLDVREPYEWSIARLPDARLIPLNSLPQSVHSLDRAAELVVYCHHGVRSEAAADWLRGRGFARVRNLLGGIDRWSLEIDPAIRRY